MCLAVIESQCLCLFLFDLLRGRTGRRMAEGGRSVKSVWRELWRLPGKRGVFIHIDPNPESCGGKANRDCHTNHEEKKQTAPDSWCQRYLQATKWLKGKSEFLSVVLFDSGREKKGTCTDWGRAEWHMKGLFPEDLCLTSLISKGIFH